MEFSAFCSREISYVHDWTSKTLRYLTPEATTSRLTSRMSTYGIRTMPILGKDRSFLGIITQADISRSLLPPNELRPDAVLTKKGFDFSKISKRNEEERVKIIDDVFSNLLRIKEDEEIAILDSSNGIYDAVKKLSEKGLGGRRYRTLVIRDNNECRGVISYLDIFNGMLKPENDSVIGGFLDQLISDFCTKKPKFLTEKSPLFDAVDMLRANPFTHLPISKTGDSTGIFGLIDDVMVRALQHELIYEVLEEMELGELLKVQCPNLENMTVDIKSTTIREALKKFTTLQIRPKSLLVGTVNSDSSINLEGILSYVDIMKGFLEYADATLKK